MTDLMEKYSNLLAEIALLSFITTVVSVIALVFFPEDIPSWFSWGTALISGSVSLSCGVGCAVMTIVVVALSRRVGVINDESSPFSC